MKKDGKLPKQRDSLAHIIGNNLFLLQIAFREAPFYSWRALTGVARNRVIVFVEHIYMIGWVINAIIDHRPFWQVALFISTVFVVVAGSENWWGNVVNARFLPVGKQKIDRAIRMELYKKAAKMDLACYDDPAFYNDFVWAMGEASTRIDRVLNTTGSFIGHFVSVAVVGGYLLTQDALGLVFVAVSFVGIFIFSQKSIRLRLEVSERTKPHKRKRDYISRELYQSDHAKEIRLNNVKGALYGEFDKAAKQVEEEAQKGTRRIAVYQFLMEFVFNTFVNGAYLFYLLYKAVVVKTIPYGTLVTMYNSCNQIRNSISSFSRTLPEFQEHSLYIDKIRHFLNYEVKISSPKNAVSVPETVEELELRDVSFSYGAEEVLKHVSLKIGKGEKIALVGYNGAGKTTLVKLLMRLYDPTSGTILYGGRDIREYDLAGYRNVFATVFQDYQLLAATVGENITMDTAPLDPARAAEAAERSGFAKKLVSFENGFDTGVTREFDENGVLLSGGESQSLVITRALYKDSPVMILDEPSSALDPIAEYNLNRLMFELEDKTVVTISHRLSTTRMATCIYMLEKGRITERGTHDELMALGGEYAEMFSLQAKKYNLQNVATAVEDSQNPITQNSVICYNS